MTHSFVTASTVVDLDIRVEPSAGEPGMVRVRFAPGVEAYLAIEDAEKLRDRLAIVIAQVKEAVA